MLVPVPPRPPLIRGRYQDAIREVMADERVQPLSWRPGFGVSENAELSEVLHYADWYVAGRADREQHHRYNRYLGTLKGYHASEKPKVHVDIGSGTGLFSWAFLDWATEKGVAYDQIRLYGLDRCQAMLDLAEMIKTKLSKYISNYPDLNNYRNVDDMLQNLADSHRSNTDYFVTFGYILIQVWEHSPHSIQDFARIIAHIVRLPAATCNVLTVDAYSGDRPAKLAAAKASLRESVVAMGIQWG